MSEELKNEVTEVVEEPIELEEPVKEMKIGDIDITLCNELVQMINDELNLTFTTDAGMDAIKAAFETCESIAYDDQTYEGYQNVKAFEYKVDNSGKEVYHIVLAKPEEEAELTEDQNFALNLAVMNMSDTNALKCISIFPTWESYIGKKLSEGIRVQHKGELWKVRQDIATVLENQAPSIETAALYERIDEEHEGTLEDPIPYAKTMTVHNGKYYVEDGIIYKCVRDSGQPLYATCASLVGDYFEKVEG